MSDVNKLLKLEPFEIDSFKEKILDILLDDISSPAIGSEREPSTTGYYKSVTAGDSLNSDGKEIADAAEFINGLSDKNSVRLSSFADIGFDLKKLDSESKPRDTSPNFKVYEKILAGVVKLDEESKKHAALADARVVMLCGGTNSYVRISNNKIINKSEKSALPSIYYIAFVINRLMITTFGTEGTVGLLANQISALDKKIAAQLAEEEKEKKAAAGGGAGGGETRERSSNEQAADLKDFLERHGSLIGGAASLEAMRDAITGRAKNADDPYCYKSYQTDITDALKAVTANEDGQTQAWNGTTIEGREFAGNDAGLLDFLRFAWVATHGEEQTWLAAAKEIGFNVGGDILPEDPTVKALIRMGAISPAGLLGIERKGGVIPKNSKLIFSPGKQFKAYTADPEGAIVVDFKRDYSAALITISAQAEPGPAPGVSADVAPTLTPDESRRVVDDWGQPTTFVLKSGDKFSISSLS